MSFRQRLIEDPKAAVEQELGTQLPEDVRVVTVEETQDTIYLVLPGAPRAGREGGANFRIKSLSQWPEAGTHKPRDKLRVRSHVSRAPKLSFCLRGLRG